MEYFGRLFGIEIDDVRKNCVLVPFLWRGVLKSFGVRRLKKGMLYGAANADNFTLIHTGIGPALAGDAVLHLGETRCENIILIGPCGLVRARAGAALGSLLSPSRCFSAESFTMLLERESMEWKAYFPDEKLRGVLLSIGASTGVADGSCMSIGSLKLQDEMRGSLIEKGIDLLDMECASVFAAAARTGRRAAALFFVSDIIGEKPLHAGLSLKDKLILALSARKAVRIVRSVLDEAMTDRGIELSQ